MSVACTSCGHPIPAGQARCGNCGEPAPREAGRPIDDPIEVPADAPVPKGTFASVVPLPSPALVPRAEASQEARTVSPPREPGASSAAAGSAHSSSQRLKQLRVPMQPPFLASASLREDLSPLAPGKETFVHTLQLAGGLGALASVLVASNQAVGWLCALVCATLALLSRLELDYTTRALLVALIAGLGLAAASAGRVLLGAGSDDPLLVVACSLLPAALMFRSWYRNARVARALVAATLMLAFAWAALTSHRGLLALGFTWQSWLPALAWSVFCILCLLSLLAFMGDETTGGCQFWGLGISAWFGLFACLRWALERDGYGRELPPLAAALGLSEAALAAALAIALAQLGARLYVTRGRLLPNAS